MAKPLDLDTQAIDNERSRINWQKFGRPRFNVEPTGATNGSNTDFVLPSMPIAVTIQVFVDGVLQQAWSNSGKTISFSIAPAGGTQVIVHYHEK